MASPLLFGVQLKAKIDGTKRGRGASTIVRENTANCSGADGKLARIVQAARVGTRAAAEADHAVFLTAIDRPRVRRGPFRGEHAHRNLLIATIKEDAPGIAIAIEPQ